MEHVPRMGRPERRFLIRLGRASGDPATALRFHAVADIAAGRSSVEVERRLDIARSTVVVAARRFGRGGVDALYDQRRSNGVRKADDRFARRVVELVRRTPLDFDWSRPTWTRELLCMQMAREGWPSVAVATMGRTLARIGARLGTPKPIVLCPWRRDAREQRLAEIRRLASRASAAEPVLYEDEVDIHLNPKIGRDWMLPGEQRRIVTPGKNEKFYLAGALDVSSGTLHTTGAAKKTAALFVDLLQLLAAAYPHARRIHLVLDNYIIHRAELTHAALAALRGRIVLHFLPPYCPDANHIERVWQDLHANVTRNHRHKTMAALLACARRYLNAYVWHQVTGAAPLMTAA